MLSKIADRAAETNRLSTCPAAVIVAREPMAVNIHHDVVAVAESGATVLARG